MYNSFEKLYGKSITNLSCSLLKHFNVEAKHKTIDEFDGILSQNKRKNVIVILLDGLGSKILERNLSKNAFLSKHKIMDINSVIPSTTVAATTSFLSGLNPVEHGWLGWDMYFKDIDKTVTVFTNKIKDTSIEAEEYNVVRSKLPYKQIDVLIREENSDVNTAILYPFGENKYNSIPEMIDVIKGICSNDKKNFIYAYVDNPDAIMHETGTDSSDTKATINMLNNEIERLYNEVEDAVIIVTADHGHINSSKINLDEYPDFKETLKHDISIESRACAFFVKEDREKEFETLFSKYFGEDFLLLAKQEVIEKKVFGIGEENKLFRDAIGDYLALATSDKYFRYDDNGATYASQHAGISEDELIIPVIVAVV